MVIGSHLSIAGGLDRAITTASEYGFDAVALFLRNQRQWRSPPLSEEAVQKFRLTRKRTGISPVVAHGSYLVNLAGLKEIRRKSIVAVKNELARCGRLGVEYLVLHPGSREDAVRGMSLIADALNTVIETCEHSRPKILLENTAGAGNTIGRSFEQLAEILSQVDRPGRLGVCLDTCHIFAAGYDIRSPREYELTMEQFDKIIGINRLGAIHANDSLGELGSHRDRHAHIGEGEIGLDGFSNFVNDPRLAKIPLILETPKGETPDGGDWDHVNVEKLRSLIKDS